MNQPNKFFRGCLIAAMVCLTFYFALLALALGWTPV